MTVDETANWIWTLGWYHGWEEAHGYHQNFRDQEISGILLPELTVEFLKLKLGIANERHRLIIMSTIRKLFPNTTVKDPEYLSLYSYVSLLVPSVNQSDFDGTKSMNPDSLSQISNHKLDGSDIMSVSCSSRDSIKTDNRYDIGSDYVQKEHQVENNVEGKLRESGGSDSQFCKSPIRKTEMSISDPLTAKEPQLIDEVSWRSRNLELKDRTLFVNLRPEQILRDKIQQIYLIRKQLSEICTYVDIRPTRKNPYIYTVVFPNSTLANEALSRSDDMEFKLIKSWLHRPRPKRPIKYKSLYPLNVNSGRSVHGKLVDKLREGDIVTVNQVKGRRARLINCKKNGETKTIGWVSLRDLDGEPFMEQLNDF